MKLYKYVSMNAAIQILKSNTIGFSRQEYFNDPFDRPFNPPVSTSNPLAQLFSGAAADVKSYIWGNNTAILSMTRTPTNPLMWAHYADSHQGVVIGIDTKAAGFLNEDSNIVPAHYGSVIYMRKRNRESYSSSFGEPVLVGNTHRFVLSHYEKWQRLFLSKPIDWAYEEEVRVAKCINGISGTKCENESGVFSIVEVAGRELHTYHLQDDAIMEVYGGVRASSSQLADLQTIRPQLTIRRCQVDLDSFEVTLT